MNPDFVLNDLLKEFLIKRDVTYGTNPRNTRDACFFVKR